MERAAWTDERLDDLADAMRTGFARVDQDIRDLRSDMNDGFREVRAELESLRQTMFRFGWGTMIGFVSVLAAILARGA